MPFSLAALISTVDTKKKLFLSDQSSKSEERVKLYHVTLSGNRQKDMQTDKDFYNLS